MASEVEADDFVIAKAVFDKLKDIPPANAALMRVRPLPPQ
jgi:hypothetical protein